MNDEQPSDLLGLTNEQYKAFKRASNRTLAIIGNDFMQEGETYTRDHIVEIVLDADYIRMHGGDKNWSIMYDKVIRPWLKDNYGEPRFNKLMKDVFPYARYGL